MGIIKAKQLVHEYIRRDEEGNVESIQTALDHIDLDVQPGQFIAILGHTVLESLRWQNISMRYLLRRREVSG